MQKDFESKDPMEMVAVAVPATPGQDAAAGMTRTFVEEFMLLGYTPERILRLFKNPVYAGVYMVYHDRGEAFVREIIAQVTSAAKGGA